MNKIHLIILALVIMISCTSKPQQQNETTTPGNDLASKEAVIEFEKKEHDFRQIFAGEKVSYSFRFVNSGTSPLLITGVNSGCGCTVGDYTKHPIQPGENGKITVVFNSAGRKGFQTQSVNVLNNSSQSPVTLKITAEVLEQ